MKYDVDCAVPAWFAFIPICPLRLNALRTPLFKDGCEGEYLCSNEASVPRTLLEIESRVDYRALVGPKMAAAPTATLP
ncbi:hypothetical protein NDU88_011454 [Pleurodeles waltl]|uniref:Uncharacterized protein n=1 Tax=Pleurodeles waltl TaxID=8319 RepID=A0AAV7QYN0_PLEWA|nr:hypothetical protein NDU88_011454 [Pleurodeles waltl]